jgi:TP901 family phage tail tape measure protein
MGSFSGALGSLFVEIGAKIDKLESGLAAASRSIDQTIGDAEKKFATFDAIGSRLSSLGTGLTAGLTLPIAAIGTVALKASADFDSALRLVSARGDITGKDLDKLKAQAEDLGAKTQFSSKQAAEGMAEFAGAGFNATQIFAALPGTLNLAAAATTDVGTAAKVVKDTLGQFGLEASETGRVVDLLTKSGNLSSGTLLELANSLKFVGPVAVAAGLSLEETNAALIVLDQAGIRGEQAGTSLRAVLASLTGPSKEAASFIKDLGVSVSDSSGKLKPFSTIIEEFRTGLSKIPNEAERANALVQIFGRESLAAANVLTTAGSPALLKFQAELSNVSGEAQRTATVMNAGLGGALERTKGSIETAAQKIGDVLAPTLIKVAGLIEAGANQIAKFAEFFQRLPEPIQNTALAFVALTAAIGPALLIAGQMAGAVTAIGTALPLASKGVTALTAAIGVSVGTLAAYTAGIVAAGAALAITLKAVADNKQAQRDLAEANKGTEASLARLEKSLQGQGADLTRLRSELDRGQITQRQYELGLRDIAIQIGKTKQATGEIKAETTTLDAAQKKIVASINQATAGFKAQGAAVAKTASEFKGIEPRYTVVTALGEKLQAEHKKHVQTLAELQLELTRTGGATVELIQPTQDLTDAVSQVNIKLLALPEALEAAFEPFADIESAVRQVEEVEAAFKRLGITSTENLNDAADQAERDYETIRQSGTASARDIEIAWVKMEEARIAASRAAGIEIPKSTEDALDQIKAKVETSTRDTVRSFSSLAKQVSTIITDLGKNVVSRIFEGDDTNDKLREQEAELRDSLKTREQDYIAFQSSVSEKLAKLQEDYRTSLEREEEELRTSLEDRKSDYEEYESEISAKLGGLAEKHKKEAEEERRKILDGLEDKTRDFDDYKGDIQKKIKDLSKKHEEGSKQEQQKLRDSLNERTKDYNRYVEDVNVKLGRIRTQNKGQTSEEEQDLQRSLQRRTADFEEFKAATLAQIDAVAVKHKAAQQEEEGELQESLARRTRDFEIYSKEVETALNGVAEKHKAEQEREEADLKASLEKKRQEYEKFRADTEEKFEKVRGAALEKLQKQESDLKAELAKQTQEWEKYKQDATAQLEQLADNYQGVFDRIKGIAEGVFADVGKAVARLVTEELVGKLFKTLGDLVDDVLPKVGKALAGVFGIGTDVLSGVGGAASGVGGAAGGIGGAAGAGGGVAGAGGAAGGAGGLLSGLNLGAALTSAFAGVFGLFQNARQETTLNAIEENTRRGTLFLGDRGDGGILGQVFRIVESVQFVQPLLDGLNAKLDNWLEPITGQIGQIISSIPLMQIRLDEISNNSLYGSAADKDNTALLRSIRDLLGANRTPNIQVFVNGVQQPSSAIGMRLQGGFAPF